MKQIIDGLRYDTASAKRIGSRSNNLPESDFRGYDEALYLTPNGRWFVAGSGGPLTHYAVSHGNERSGSSAIHPISPKEAELWLADGGYLGA